MECPDCNGSGCPICDDIGTLDLIGCPLEIIDPGTWELIDYADLYRKGLPPVAGGALDQTAFFLAAARWIFSEQNYWKRKIGLING